MASDDFESFLRERHGAAAAYVSGNAEPLNGLVASQHMATFFSPRGDVTTGTEAVASRYKRDASVFAEGSDNSMETLDAAAGDEIAFWVGRQKSQARMHGQDEPVAFDLRVTEIYRREEGRWKLVHRHADPVHEQD
jgi:ketosteroid isomerase-like protein